MKYDIITIGSVTRDAFFKSDAFKVEKNPNVRTGEQMCLMLGTKIAVQEVVFTTGGGGTNTAVGFSRQGLRTASICRIGDDISGKAIIEEFEKEGVANLSQVDKEYPTAFSLILVAPDGERTILEHRGANDHITEKEIDWSGLESEWLFLDSLAGNTNLMKEAIDWAKKNDVKIACNPGKKMVQMGRELRPFIEGIDIFISNEDEAGLITGVEPGNTEKIFEEMDKIIKEVVVMTRGPKGVMVSDGKNIYSAGTPDSPVVDRTGAGDAFSAGFVSGYINSGGDIENAIQLGTANATSVVQYFGAKKGHLKKGDWGGYPKIEVAKN